MHPPHAPEKGEDLIVERLSILGVDHDARDTLEAKLAPVAQRHPLSAAHGAVARAGAALGGGGGGGGRGGGHAAGASDMVCAELVAPKLQLLELDCPVRSFWNEIVCNGMKGSNVPLQFITLHVQLTDHVPHV